MVLKKDRKVRKIEVPTYSVPEFELRDTEVDIQWRREEGEAREREEAQQQHQREEEARAEETHSPKEGVAETRPRTEKSDTKTEVGEEAGPSQS